MARTDDKASSAGFSGQDASVESGFESYLAYDKLKNLKIGLALGGAEERDLPGPTVGAPAGRVDPRTDTGESLGDHRPIENELGPTS